MGSRLALTEKRPAKRKGLGGVLFQFFDWNKMLSKKKKKLFLNNKLLLPSASKKFGGDERIPKPKPKHKLFLIADENLEGSKFPQKQNGLGLDNNMRDPGLVAKLMGLESMPIVQNTKPVEFDSNEYETCEAKESRPQKLQRTGGFIERRQQPVASSSSEALQSNQRARRLHHHHKLAPPAKSPRLLAKRSTSRLMVAATKVPEPGSQSQRNHARCALTYTGSKEGVFMKKFDVLMNNSVIGTSRSFKSLSEAMELGLKDNEKRLSTLESRTPSPFGETKVDAKRSLVTPIVRDGLTSPNVEPKTNAYSRHYGLYSRRKNLIQNQLYPGSNMCVASDSNLSGHTHSRRVIKESGSERGEIDRNEQESKNKDPKRRPNDDLQAENGDLVSLTFEKRHNARNASTNRKSISRSSVRSEFTNRVEGNSASGREGNGIFSFSQE